MNELPPNIDPKLSTISAIIIGFALIDNLSAAEQAAVGNWFITIGQTLFNNATWQVMIESRIAGNTLNINSKNFKTTGNPYMDNQSWIKSPVELEIERLRNIIIIMQDELEKMK